MKALMKLPETDFMLCLYLLPVAVQKDAQIEMLKSLWDKLETCQFKVIPCCEMSFLPPFKCKQTHSGGIFPCTRGVPHNMFSELGATAWRCSRNSGRRLAGTRLKRFWVVSRSWKMRCAPSSSGSWP